MISLYIIQTSAKSLIIYSKFLQVPPNMIYIREEQQWGPVRPLAVLLTLI